MSLFSSPLVGEGRVWGGRVCPAGGASIATSQPTMRTRLSGLAVALALAAVGRVGLAEEPSAAPSDAGVPATTPAEPAAPFAFADFSWEPGNGGSNEKPLSWGPFTGELRVDVAYHHDFSNPIDDTIVGSSEVFRSN